MILYGASGHGKVIADILKKSGIYEIMFWDDDPQVRIEGYKVVQVPEEYANEDEVILSIGNNATRFKIAGTGIYKWGKAIHPNAIIAENVTIENGSVLMAGVIVNSCTKIGAHCIINTSSSVDHDCIIDSFVHISPNATIAGGVKIGTGAWIGAGAVLIQNIKIGKWAIIGAGSILISDVPDYAVVVGNPGRIIKYTSSRILLDNPSTNNDK